MQVTQRIESSLDATLTSPIHYTWNVSYGRQFPKGMYFEASYIGRAARNLLATRDVMALNNLVDRHQDTDWYTAAGRLHDLRAADAPLFTIRRIFRILQICFRLGASLAAFWGDDTYATLTPTQAVYYMVARDGYDILDWTFIQLAIDDDYSGNNGWNNSFSTRNMRHFRHSARLPIPIITADRLRSDKDSEKHYRLISTILSRNHWTMLRVCRPAEHTGRHLFSIRFDRMTITPLRILTLATFSTPTSFSSFRSEKIGSFSAI